MNKHIRFDSVGGASGDMILAALASIGADLENIEQELNRFFPEELHIEGEPASECGLNGIRLSVHSHHHPHHDDSHWPDAEQQHNHHHDDSHWPDAEQQHNRHHHDHQHHQHQHHEHQHEQHHEHHHRGLKEIVGLIENSSLPEKTKLLSTAVFERLAEAEAKVHGKTADTVHFHEVGAWDSVADIVGSCLALEQLGIDGISCSALPCGTGTLRCAHGEMPNPAPATQILLEGVPVVQTDEPFEMVTPTGAALLATWLEKLESPPVECVPVTSGFGFGSRRLNGRPNVLRATIIDGQPAGRALRARPYTPRENQSTALPLPVSNESSGDSPSRTDLSRTVMHREGEAPAEPPSAEKTLTVLETNLDDCNPEWLGSLVEDLLDAGALDAWHTPIVMKKGRPAVMLSVLTKPENAGRCKELIFRSTTTFGIRTYSVSRTELERDFIEVRTQWGTVPVKCGRLNGELITIAPEHEACLRLARENGLTVREVSEAAKAAAASS